MPMLDAATIDLLAVHANALARTWAAARRDGAPAHDLVGLVIDGKAFDPVRPDEVRIALRSRLRGVINKLLAQSRFPWQLESDDAVLSEALAHAPPGHVRVYTAVMQGPSLCTGAFGLLSMNGATPS